MPYPSDPTGCRTPLTIPLQITLSDFKLSGFVILVFSKQKGITVVFRNDPLESLKVSSTFDSISFVRDFLQKEIEGQLRVLFMDELPAIIHRLSLRLWVPEYRAGEEMQNQMENAASEGPGQDPLASPPEDPVDSSGNALNEAQVASLSLDSSIETHSLFSQKNLLRLAALTDSQRTLSLFTPSIREVVYRAWTGPDQGDLPGGVASPLSPALSRSQSQIGSLSLQDNASTVSMQSRYSTPSGFNGYGLSLGAGRHSKAHAKKRKKRVVDLRRRPKTTDDASVTDSTLTESAPSVYSEPLPAVNEQPDDPVTPPLSPQSDYRLPVIPERRTISRTVHHEVGEPSSAADNRHSPKKEDPEVTPRGSMRRAPSHNEKQETASEPPRQLPSTILPFTKDKPSSTGFDQGLVEKLAGEIARRIREEKLMETNSCGNFWDGPKETPPPAYGQ